jgi:hypothetical protein
MHTEGMPQNADASERVAGGGEVVLPRRSCSPVWRWRGGERRSGGRWCEEGKGGSKLGHFTAQGAGVAFVAERFARVAQDWRGANRSVQGRKTFLRAILGGQEWLSSSNAMEALIKRYCSGSEGPQRTPHSSSPWYGNTRSEVTASPQRNEAQCRLPERRGSAEVQGFAGVAAGGAWYSTSCFYCAASTASPTKAPISAPTTPYPTT